MTEGAQRGGAVAGVEERSRNPAQIAGPHEVVDVIAVVIGLAPGCGRRGDECAGVGFVLETAQHRERRPRKHPLIPADLRQRLGHVELRTPGSFESLADVAGSALQRCAGDLFGISAGMRETDRDLERTGTDAYLSTDRDVARPGAIVGVGEVAVAVA